MQPDPPRLRLLGPPTLEQEGASTAVAVERRTQLLAFLAVKRAWVGRTEVAALLWPELAPKLAYTNLRKALFRLQSVSWGRHVSSEGGALRCDLATDVADFEAALREGRPHQALSLWNGELAEGFDDDANPSWSSWLAFERDRLHAAWRNAALEVVQGEVEAADALTIAARLLDADPLDEAALRAQMTWLARTGQAARARQAYREFASRLETELGIAPGAALRAHHDTLGTARPLEAPRRADAGPAEGTGFVGRVVELRQLAAMLGQAACRLVTVIGPGGVGKTRFVQRALAEAGSAHAHGAVFVPLDDVRAVGDVPARLAHELGLRVAPRRAPLDVVHEFLRDRSILLVLDNLEHLAGMAPLIEGLLAAGPGVRIIATSRARVAVAAEQLLPLEGMPYPEAEDADSIEAFDAVRLFVRAAHRVEPALVPSAEADAIADICRQLDGLPLALELAAAWTRILSCDAIAAELREGAGLLRTDDPVRPARHASFEVVFDHSWRLLRDSERAALARLSVFRGGFTASAARSVARAPLPVLLALVDKSLLRKQGDRLTLHPLVAECAAARLAAMGDEDATRAGHGAHYLGLLVHLAAGLDRGAPDAMRVVDAEFENCRSAWRAALAAGADEPVRAARALMAYCDHRGLVSVAQELIEEALSSPASRDPRARLELESRRAHVLYRLDRYDAAAGIAEGVLAQSDPERDVAAILQALSALAGCCLRRGELLEAQRHYRQATALASRQGPREVAALMDNLSIVTKRLGDVDGALDLTLRALAMLRRTDDPANLALCLNNLGSHYQQRGDYASARPHLVEAQALTDRHGLVSTRAFVCANLAACARHLGDLTGAQAYIVQGMAAAQTAGNRNVECWLHYLRGSVAIAQGDLVAAREDLAAMTAVATAIASPYLTLGAVDLLADILVAERDVGSARQLLRYAARVPQADPGQVRELEARLAALPATEDECPWPGIELAELAQRIVAEKDLAHAPLLALLRGAG